MRQDKKPKLAIVRFLKTLKRKFEKLIHFEYPVHYIDELKNPDKVQRDEALRYYNV